MLELKDIVKRYQYEKVLDHIDMIFPDTGMIAVIGPSGCGKSTLLHIIGGIDNKYQGEVLFDGKKMKKRNIGFLFQSFHLVSWLKVNMNIHLPLFYRRNKYPKYNHDLGISEYNHQYVHMLSLGQRQRVAYLRAISFYPDILLCDEPTASLDSYHANELMKLLKEESKRRLIIFVSHDIHLVLEYSDEIYEMKDGQIVHHQIYHQNNKASKEKYPYKPKIPRILLSLFSMKENKARLLQMMSGLVLSLTTILIVLSLTQGFRNQLNMYIEKMVPASSISYRLKNHQQIENSIQDSKILHTHLYPDEYELLGISPIADRYSQGISTSIFDDSGYPQELLYGDMMSNEYEIVVSKKTAIHFLGSNDIKELLDVEVMIWYKHINEVKGKIVKIVGISKEDNDCIYYYPYGNISLIKDIYDVRDVKCSYGLLYVEDVESDIKYLEKTYRDYEFIIVGKSTKDSVQSFMEKANIVLLLFASLAILSSLFLIGEVMFLEVVQKRKDIAIMKCFGAHVIDVVCFVFYQSMIIYVISVIVSLFSFLSLKNLLNTFFEKELLIDISLIVIDFKMIIVVYGVGLLLLFLSLSIPLIYALKMNTVESLKINS